MLLLLALTMNFKITDVTVYRSSAKIHRIATKTLSKGEYIVRTNLIPGNLAKESIKITSKEGVTIGEVKVVKAYPDSVFKKEIKVLKDSLEIIEDRITTVENKLKCLDTEEKFVQAISVTMPEKYSQDLSIGKGSTTLWAGTLRFISSELSRIDNTRVKLQKKRERLKEVKSKLEKKLSEYTDSSKEINYITFPLVVKKNGTYTFSLEYVVYNTGWDVHYIVRANPEKKKVILEYYGDVYQNTGEDWDNIRLELSTAVPSLGAQAPQPVPWYISVYAPVRAKRMAPTIGITEEAVAEDKLGLKGLRETPISLVYKIPGKKVLETGKTPSSFLINTMAFTGEYSYFVAPRFRKDAFLKVKTKNTSKNLYLPGRASVFVGTEYVGKGYISGFAPGEEIELSCGIDTRITVERELVKRLVEERGLLRKTKSILYVYKNTVKNNLSGGIKLFFMDVYPVSQDSRIKVKDVKFSSTPDSTDVNKGFAYWNLTLSQGETFVETTSFRVEFPKDLKPSNLY